MYVRMFVSPVLLEFLIYGEVCIDTGCTRSIYREGKGNKGRERRRDGDRN